MGCRRRRSLLFPYLLKMGYNWVYSLYFSIQHLKHMPWSNEMIYCSPFSLAWRAYIPSMMDLFLVAWSILKFSYPIAVHSFNSLFGEFNDISIATEHVMLIFISWLHINVSIFPRQIRFISFSLTLGFNHVNCERNGFFPAKPRWKAIFPS